MKVVILGVSGNLGTSLASRLAHDPAVMEIAGVSRREAALGLRKRRHVRADVTRDDLASLCRGAGAVRVDLAFRRQWSSVDALVEVLHGMRAGAGLPTSPLGPQYAAKTS